MPTTASVALFNWTNSTWANVGTVNVGTQDGMHELMYSSLNARFMVNAVTRRVRARVTFSGTEAFTSNVDVLEFGILPTGEATSGIFP